MGLHEFQICLLGEFFSHNLDISNTTKFLHSEPSCLDSSNHLLQSILGQNWNIKELKEADPSKDESLIVAERYSEDNGEVESSVAKIQDLHVKLGSLEKAEFEASACMCSNVNQ